MKISLGVSLPIHRFLSSENVKGKIQVLIDRGLNAIEFGLLNCVIGRPKGFSAIPYPTESQISAILETISISKFYLSTHGPYRISATSEEPSKLKFSKANLSAALKTTDLLHGRHITFHAGSFKQKHNNLHVQKILAEWENWRQEKGYQAVLAPEVGGKYNSFADFFTLVDIASSIDNCLITWDISHDFARGGNITSEEGILKRLDALEDAFSLSHDNRLPVHFSGMEVGKRGEKAHTLLDQGTGVPWKLLFSVLKNQNYLDKLNLICESKVPRSAKLKGDAISDAIKVKTFLESGEIVSSYKGKRGHLDYYFR